MSDTITSSPSTSPSSTSKCVGLAAPRRTRVCTAVSPFTTKTPSAPSPVAKGPRATRSARAFFAEKGVADYRLVDSQGATEAGPKNLTAEAIVDIASVESVEPLGALGSLTSLSVAGCPVADIGPVAGLERL